MDRCGLHDRSGDDPGGLWDNQHDGFALCRCRHGGDEDAAQPSPGCGTPRPAPGPPRRLGQPSVGGARVAIVHLPSGYHGETATPLVPNLHGSGSTAAAQEAFTQMNTTADQEGFIVVHPQGDITAGSGFERNVPNEPLIGGATVPTHAPDDVAFLKDLVTYLEGHYCVDERRVVATGFSGGARTTSQLGCDASEIFAAIAPVSGLRHPTPCPTTRAVSVISFHSTVDPVDPYNENDQAYWTYSVPVAAQRWAAQNGCSSSPKTTNPSPRVKVTSYGHCTDGSAIELYAIAGEGHEWPGERHLPKRLTRLSGPQFDAVNANATMWASSKPIRCRGRSRVPPANGWFRSDRWEAPGRTWPWRLREFSGVARERDVSRHG